MVSASYGGPDFMMSEMTGRYSEVGCRVGKLPAGGAAKCSRQLLPECMPSWGSQGTAGRKVAAVQIARMHWQGGLERFGSPASPDGGLHEM